MTGYRPLAYCRFKRMGLTCALLWVAAALVAVLCLPMIALAHGVIVFAWVEGDTVYTESKFQSGKKVHDGEILVHGPEGNLLFSGRTDENGAFSFPVPQQTDLKITVRAGMGHQNSWTVPAGEIRAAAGEGEGGAPLPDAQNPPDSPASPGRETRPAAAPAGDPPPAAPDQLQAAVERALDKKLAPVIRLLAESRQAGPGLTEILGGIGYILGLVGLAAFMRYRRQGPGK